MLLFEAITASFMSVLGKKAVQIEIGDDFSFASHGAEMANGSVPSKPQDRWFGLSDFVLPS